MDVHVKTHRMLDSPGKEDDDKMIKLAYCSDFIRKFIISLLRGISFRLWLHHYISVLKSTEENANLSTCPSVFMNYIFGLFTDFRILNLDSRGNVHIQNSLNIV